MIFPRAQSEALRAHNLLIKRRTRVLWDGTLRRRTGTYAQTSGVFRYTIYIDPSILWHGSPVALHDFCIWHETAHVLGYHGFWRTRFMKWLLFPIYPLICRWQEKRADLYALSHMPHDQFVVGLIYAHPPQRTWFGRMVYGKDWRARARRVGINEPC